MTAHRMQFPDVPGKTPREKFENLARMMFAVPKAEIDQKTRRKKKRKTAGCALVIGALVFSGCVSVVRGPTQQVVIDSAPQGALVTIADGRTCTTPCSIEARRLNSLQVQVEHAGCKTAPAAMFPTLASAGFIAALIPFFGMIDYGIGGVYDLKPNPLFVTMTCSGQQ